MAYYRINDISISGNTIQNVNTNGNIVLLPNGTGIVDTTTLQFDNLLLNSLSSATGVGNNDIFVMVANPTGTPDTLKITGNTLRSSLLNQPAQLQFRQGLDSERLLVTPASGEPIWVTDTNRLYIGNGSTVGGVGVSMSGHNHTSSNITDFNSSISGLLPVKNILAGPNISISSTSGTYSIGVSGSLGLTTEEVDDRIASLLVAGTGINISYDDINNSLILSSENYYGANRGIINVTSSTSSFNVPGGYTVGSFDLFLNGVKLIDNVDFTATNGYSFTAASPIPSGSTLEFISLTLANPLHIASDQYSAGISRDIINVTGTLSTINIVGGYDVGGLDLYKDGLKLIKNIQYTANNGSSITLNTPASSGSVIEYVSFIAGKARRSLNKISSNTIAGSVPQTDYIYVASSPLTVTLPSASGNNNRYTIKNMSNSIVSVVPFTGQTIDQQTIIAISTKYNSVDVVSDGENWIII